MIGESSMDRGHVLDKLGVVPLSTKPLHAQERMASEADRRGRLVRHIEIGHGDSTQKCATASQASQNGREHKGSRSG